MVMLASLALVGTSRPGDAGAQATKPAEEPEIWRLSVRAQAVTRPALAHGLLVKPVDQIPGNAAPIYLNAMAEARRVDVPPVDNAALAAKGLPPSDEHDMMYYYLGWPLDRLPVAELEAFMRPYESSLTLLDAAVRREHCHWEVPIRDMGLATLLPYLNDARHLTNVASLRVRLDAARGDYAAAVRGMRAIYQMGRHVGDDGLLIQALVGTGLASVAAERAKEVIRQPGAPNLYWPLANLPRPFVSLRETLEWEALGLMATLSPLQKVAEGKRFTAADWEDLVNRQGQVGRLTGTRDFGFVSLDSAFGPAAAGALLYPEAKRYLLARGMSPEQVDALPVPEALGRYVYGEYQAAFDEVVKWAGLPYWEAQPGMARAQREIFTPSASIPVRAIASMIPASATRAALQFARHDSRVAALQTVEALRAFAATHDGKLPETLDALAEAGTPAPLNPFTGQSPGYRVEGGRALVDFPAVPADAARHGLTVEVTVTK